MRRAGQGVHAVTVSPPLSSHRAGRCRWRGVCKRALWNYRGGTQEAPGRRMRRRRGGSTRRLHARSAETPSCRALGRRPIRLYRNALARRSRTARGAATSVQRRKRTTPSTVNHNRWICQRNTRTRYTRTFQKCAECMRASRETGARTAIVTSVWCSVSAVSLSEPPRERPHTAPARATGQRGVRGDTHV